MGRKEKLRERKNFDPKKFSCFLEIFHSFVVVVEQKICIILDSSFTFNFFCLQYSLSLDLFHTLYFCISDMVLLIVIYYSPDTFCLFFLLLSFQITQF